MPMLLLLMPMLNARIERPTLSSAMFLPQPGPSPHSSSVGSAAMLGCLFHRRGKAQVECGYRKLPSAVQQSGIKSKVW